MAICPSCGKEVGADFGYCPFCATPLKPFCPSCKRELQPGYVACPYCGFRLEARTQARQLYQKGTKSLFLRVITVLAFVSAVVDIIQGANEGTFQFANFNYQGPIPETARYLALAQVPVGAVAVVVGILMLWAVYGLIYGTTFPRRYLLKLVSLGFLLSIILLSVDGAITSTFPLPPVVLSFDVFFAAWSLLVLGVTYRYVRQQEVREILRATEGSQPT